MQKGRKRRNDRPAVGRNLSTILDRPAQRRSPDRGRWFEAVRALLLPCVLGWSLPCPAADAKDPEESFPVAAGWANTPGGRKGTLVRVTTLAADGAGSFAAALRTRGPRLIVFEVGGVIDLAGKQLTLAEPFVTVAGQTAPAPGITLVRGGFNIATHDVIVQHLRVRPGEAGHAPKSGWEIDGIGTIAAANVIIDHCSCTWATDENLSASGPRFEGATVEEWRAHTSHHITFSHCIIAEGLSHSSHGKGEHSKGSLLHDNTTALTVIGNLYASNVERSPLAKGGVQAVIVNNWISNPGRRAIHHALNPGEWSGHEPVPAKLALVGNVLEYGPDTVPDLPLFFNHAGPVEMFMEDNLALDRARQPAALVGGLPALQSSSKPLWPPGLEALPAAKVKEHVARNAGARPWDRDPIDQRIVQQAMEGGGRVINHETEGGGYPAVKETRQTFNPGEWNLDTMERRPSAPPR
jgi:hypothetical protein